MRRAEPCWGTVVSVDVRDDVDDRVLDDVYAWFARVDALFSTFPDFHYRILESTEEGDRVVCKVTMTGTHRGQPTALPEAFGGMLAGVAPTGKRVEVLQFHSFRVQGSQIGEHSAVRDDLGMCIQLGLIRRPS